MAVFVYLHKSLKGYGQILIKLSGNAYNGTKMIPVVILISVWIQVFLKDLLPFRDKAIFSINYVCTVSALISTHGQYDQIFAKVGMGVYDNEKQLGVSKKKTPKSGKTVF